MLLKRFLAAIGTLADAAVDGLWVHRRISLVLLERALAAEVAIAMSTRVAHRGNSVGTRSSGLWMSGEGYTRS